MSKVWVVLADAFDDAEVVGVFDNKEDAAEAVRIFLHSTGMESYELNALPKHPQGCLRYGVSFDYAGKLKYAYRENPLSEGGSCTPTLSRVNTRLGLQYGERFIVRLWAKTEEEAIKVATDIVRKELDNG